MKNVKLLFLCALMGLNAYAAPELLNAEATPIEVDAGKADDLISEYLTGSHFVYAYENDTLYQDERISDWMKESKVKIIRWPGGTAVQNYHWDDLNGVAFKWDSWNPNFPDSLRQPQEGFMDVDEYVAFCRKVGAEPMIGINILSGRKYKGPGQGKEGSLDEARRLIQHCVDHNYQVKYWYIGNETYKMFGKNSETYAAYIDDYAEVLKSVDPDINIIGDWQFGPEKTRFPQIIKLAKTSKHIDMVEIHEKWGNGYGLGSGKTFAQWKEESPIYNGKLGRLIDRFQDSMKVAGLDVKLSMNEWGLSGNGYTDAGEFECGLMAADFLMELCRHKVATACYWNLNLGGHDTKILNTYGRDSLNMVHQRLNYISPVGHAFSMISTAMGKHLVPFETGMKKVYGFAALASDRSVLDIYLMNKEEGEVVLPLTLKNFAMGAPMVQHYYAAPGEVTEKTYVADDMNMVLPGLSFSHFIISSGEATHIDEIKVEDCHSSDVIFDLGGKRVEYPQKGVYIVNGKKTLVK